MPYGQRTFNPSGSSAEGDKFFGEFVYDDVSGNLTIGKPVYAEVLDAAEYNNLNSSTALTPATSPTGGKVVLGTNAAAGANLTCVGVYQPGNPGDKPNKGDSIRVLINGRGIVSAQSPAAGAAGTVGGTLIASAAVTDAVPGARAAGITIGTLLATKTFVTAGVQIFAAASATATLCNAYVSLS
jgi:hypothetical protein